MKTFAIVAYVVQHFKTDGRFQAWIEMPAGARPFAVTPHGEGLAVIALGDPTALSVQHPIWIMPVGEVVELPIGTAIGSFIGTANLGGAPVCVFKSLDWPTSTLDARRPAGVADA